jgi:response regulator NasT
MCPDNPPLRYRLLLVEDDRLFSAALSLSLEAAGHAVTSTPSTEDALEVLAHHSFDLVIIDEGLPGCSGLDLAAILRERFRLPFFFLTGCDRGACIERAIGEGALAYLLKPVDVAQLITTIATVLARSADLADLRKTRDQLQTALDQERDVSIATGIVMARVGLDRAEAFEFLRRAARSSRRKLADVARELIENRGTALKADALLP